MTAHDKEVSFTCGGRWFHSQVAATAPSIQPTVTLLDFAAGLPVPMLGKTHHRTVLDTKDICLLTRGRESPSFCIWSPTGQL